MITFDDGYANNYSLAFPILQRYRAKATVFLTTGFVDRRIHLGTDRLDYLVHNAPGDIHEFVWRGQRIRLRENADGPGEEAPGAREFLKRLPFEETHAFLQGLQERIGIHYDWDAVPPALLPLHWHEIRKMHESGLVVFGAHTFSHPILSHCPVDVQEFEIGESKRRVEGELGVECTLFAYPNGMREDYTQETKTLLTAAGFTYAFTAEGGHNAAEPQDPYELKRWGTEMNQADLIYLLAGGASAMAQLTRLTSSAPPAQ
ncbi:MAG: polysaccharide deacetylase family protein [Acidobacteria bacterium]|nr:polysaccharide deacetylase family protein [Acidobacteriota bacterium]